MANHNNYANDRDLMMEAYGSVQGEVPATSSTAMPRMLNEAHCDEEHEGSEETVKVELELELDKETAKDLHDQLMDEVVEEEPAEGELPAEDSGCATHSDEEHSEDNESEEQGEEAGFNSKQIEELEDIVHAILDKREHEERAAKYNV